MTEADVGSVWWHVAWDTGTGRFCAVPTALTLRSIGSFPVSRPSLTSQI